MRLDVKSDCSYFTGKAEIHGKSVDSYFRAITQQIV